MSYSIRCKLLTCLCSVLFVLLLLAPGVIFWLFGVPQSETADLIARRAAMLFLGLAVISWNAHSAPPSIGFSLGIVVAMLGLASAGSYEFLRGFAEWPILLAVIVEVSVAGLFLKYTRHRKSLR